MEKSVDDIIINVPFSLRHLHLINEILSAYILTNILSGNKIDIVSLQLQCQQIYESIIDAINSTDFQLETKDGARAYVTDTYFEFLKDALVDDFNGQSPHLNSLFERINHRTKREG